MVSQSCRLTVGLVAFATALPTFAALPTFESITLGAASGFTLFDMGPTVMNASNTGTLFEGNLGLASGASTNFSGGGTLTGTLYKDPGASVQSNLSSQFHVNGGVVTTSLTQAVTDVKTASQNAAQLTATQTYSGNLTNGATFYSTGQYNVVDIMGSVTVTSPSKNITFAGASSDWYIVNVFGSVSVSNGTIGLSGGLTADHVLVNVLGGDIYNLPTDNVSLSNASSSLYGTYIDTTGKITLSPGTVYGAIMAYQIQTSSGPKVYSDIYSGPSVSPIPEPETYAMLLAGLGLIGVWTRRRDKRVPAFA